MPSRIVTETTEHPYYKFFANHFLADSPRTVADKHYVTPIEEDFFHALGWLRTQLLGSGSPIPEDQPR